MFILEFNANDIHFFLKNGNSLKAIQFYHLVEYANESLLIDFFKKGKKLNSLLKYVYT